MPKVALIYPYFRTRAQTELLFTPLGIACLAAQLHELRIEAKIFDCTFSTFEDVRESLIAYQPEIIGIYSMITLSRNTFQIAEMIRTTYPECLLVAGGPLPTLYPERFTPAFDVVFRGEADLSFPHFCQDFFAQKGTHRQKLAALPLETYPGLFIQHGNLQTNNPTVHYSERLINTFPLPYRGDFDHAAYHQAGMIKDGSKTTSIITTYGCSFDCDFCSKPVFGNRFRRRYPDEVFKEIEQIQQLGYDTLWIADDNFTLDLNYLKEFCRRMNGRTLKWTCLSRVTGINLEIAQMMKAAGCHRVYLGLESGSQATLKLMNKRATLQEGIDAVHIFREAGIEVGAFFIVGYPGETVEAIEETFRFALDLPLTEISFNVPFPLP
ncbi:B12-binding domain-containing radical SAM protein, partial [bacterium]|nr:B12-binding domain-containing radical SAM protein [bacterium]